MGSTTQQPRGGGHFLNSYFGKITLKKYLSFWFANALYLVGIYVEMAQYALSIGVENRRWGLTTTGKLNNCLIKKNLLDCIDKKILYLSNKF